MFREWREVTMQLLKGKAHFTPKYQLTYKYIRWVKRKKQENPRFFDGFQQMKGIIKARNTFLLEEKLPCVGEHIIAAAKDFTLPEETITSLESLSIYMHQNKKVLIIPIATVGAGKSTLGQLLSQKSPVTFAHIQSDHMPRKYTSKHFVKHLIDAFDKADVVYADRNNHLRQHRKALGQAFRQKYPSGLMIALDWQVETYRPNDVIEFCEMRILSR
jgi:tRNA ligase